jgi:hypothetical protein
MKTQKSKQVLSEPLAEPLNGATAARVEIRAGDGNLAIDRLAGGEPLLASGSLQYLEKQGPPARSLELSGGQAHLTLQGGGGQPWFRLPWAACNGATEWQIHLNPTVSLELNAHSDGGNLRLDLAGMDVTRVSADTGGGNMDVVLPGQASRLLVTAKTGAGNVTAHIPGGVAARIHTATGLGKAMIDPRFSQTGKDTYESPDFDGAAHQAELTLSSGAGNVIVDTL